MPDQVTLKPLPFKEAIEAFRRRMANQVKSFAWQDVWQAEHGRAFTVAKGMSDDVLSAIAGEVEKALAGGTTFETFQRELRPKLEEFGWWGRAPMTDPASGAEREVQLGSPRRLEIILDTNMRVSHAAGKWEQVQRVKETRPYLRYVAVLDSRTRAEHRAWHGTVLPVDDPWWDTHYPPNGWRCRCTVMSVAAPDLQRNGWAVDDSPKVEYREWMNKRTGQLERVPVGIDPGFGYNPGAAAVAGEQ